MDLTSYSFSFWFNVLAKKWPGSFQLSILFSYFFFINEYFNLWGNSSFAIIYWRVFFVCYYINLKIKASALYAFNQEGRGSYGSLWSKEILKIVCGLMSAVCSPLIFTHPCFTFLVFLFHFSFLSTYFFLLNLRCSLLTSLWLTLLTLHFSKLNSLLIPHFSLHSHHFSLLFLQLSLLISYSSLLTRHFSLLTSQSLRIIHLIYLVLYDMIKLNRLFLVIILRLLEAVLHSRLRPAFAS